MTKTQNYQLNQWDAADTIRREDFNGAMANIDAALAQMAEKAGGAFDGGNPPWETGILELEGAVIGTVVKTFSFAPTAILISARTTIPGFALNGQTARPRHHTSSGYVDLALSGNTLTVVGSNNEPVTTLQYLALK